MRQLSGLFLAFLGLIAQSMPAAASASLARAENAWRQRAEGHVGSRAAAEPIAEAVAAFSEALTEDPANLAVRARLLRALYFQGEHAVEDRETKVAIFERGRDLAEEAIDQVLSGIAEAGERPSAERLAERLEDRTAAAEMYFWAAAHWGLWGRSRGRLASARQGVAGKIRDRAEVVIALDESLEAGGGHRILGRLHAEAPRLPFITGWIDRGFAVEELERAVELFPDEPMNRLYLFEALLLFEPSRRAEAIAGLRGLLQRPPDPKTLLEDLKVLEDARRLLEQHEP